MTLTVGGQGFKVAEASTGPLNQWRWERVGTVDLPKGKQTLSLGRIFDGNFPWQIFIDSLVFSRQPSFDPSRQSDWEPQFNSQLVNSSTRQFTLPNALPPGDYRWRIRVFDGDRLLAGDGAPGIQSAYSAFRVTE